MLVIPLKNVCRFRRPPDLPKMPRAGRKSMGKNLSPNRIKLREIIPLNQSSSKPLISDHLICRVKVSFIFAFCRDFAGGNYGSERFEI